MSTKHYLIILALLTIGFFAYATFVPGEYHGAAHEGIHIIKHSYSDYQPWFSSIWTPPSKPVTVMLFTLQGSIGALVLGYYAGKFKERSKA
ncbi:MAG: ABC-type cobalt transport system, periplasmic component [Candidatus Methanohalarchaeum thermophilum]|uniref:ABC-type cobalt transport system, periplasmic component n=1 Tax=Methanohalarchaeum thermophilum TaxID=1903181 RepID=A0A1Q6DVI6_METT1|nr:MAG: ABC-type cobalt transport system, periplasmic component [Candidatus Methanohalarchaeum thermophilum]